MTATCTHPATALYSWIARDDSQPNGQDLVITCTNCHAILKGAATLDDYPQPSDAQIEAMLEDMARTYGYGDPCANCGEPLTDDGGQSWYCAECYQTAAYHD